MSYYEKAEEIKEQNIHNFTIDNFELMDSLYEMFKEGHSAEDKKVAMEVLHLMAEKQVNSYFGKFPTLMDNLSMQTMYYSPADLKGKKLEDKFCELHNMLRDAEDHILIGYEMGFNDTDIAIYDALVGTHAHYNPRMVKVARAVSQYVKDHPTEDIPHTPEARLHYNDLLWAEVKRLLAENHTWSIDEDMVPAYLFGEVLHTDVTKTSDENGEWNLVGDYD